MALQVWFWFSFGGVFPSGFSAFVSWFLSSDFYFFLCLGLADRVRSAAVTGEALGLTASWPLAAITWFSTNVESLGRISLSNS